MATATLKAGAISVAALIAAQVIRFAGNIMLARLLSPSAFGVVAVVNMALLGLSLFSDLGLRQIVIQRQGQLTAQFLNIVWTLQIWRGLFIGAVTVLLGGVLWLLQNAGWVEGNTYADPLLPLLIAGAAISPVMSGFDSTRLYTAYRSLNLSRVAAVELVAQVLAMVLMLAVAWWTASPWALVLGSMANLGLRTWMSHTLLPGEPDRRHWDRAVVVEILKKSRWILVSSPLTFLELNGAVLMLGGLLGAGGLGVFMIAFQLCGVVQLVAQNLASNVIFPRLSAALQEGRQALQCAYVRLQLVADGLVVTAAGALMACGQVVVDTLFDQRYAQAGSLLSSLALGLVGNRLFVVEQLINANGDFRLNPLVILCRIAGLVSGVLIGFSLGGAQGAAFGIGLSWFAAWPILLWYRSKTMAWHLWSEAAALAFLVAGYGLGMLLAFLINHFHVYQGR